MYVFVSAVLGRQHLPLLSIPADIIVPTLVQYEIFKWLKREQTAEDANRAITFTDDCEVVDLSAAIAVLAAELSATHKLHTTNAIIYATAQIHDAPLVTFDANFKGLPGVENSER